MADYNIDGLTDLAVADAGDNSVSVLLNLGGGTFGPDFELPAGTDPVSITTADFNGDGKPDVATANNGSNNVSVILIRRIFRRPAPARLMAEHFLACNISTSG